MCACTGFHSQYKIETLPTQWVNVAEAIGVCKNRSRWRHSIDFSYPHGKSHEFMEQTFSQYNYVVNQTTNHCGKHWFSIYCIRIRRYQLPNLIKSCQNPLDDVNGGKSATLYIKDGGISSLCPWSLYWRKIYRGYENTDQKLCLSCFIIYWENGYIVFIGIFCWCIHENSFDILVCFGCDIRYSEY